MKNRNRISIPTKLLFVVALSFCISITAFAGNEKADKIYAQLETNQDVFSMSLSKKMIDFFDLDVDLNGKEKLIKGDFTEGRMMVIQDMQDSEMVRALFKNENYSSVKLENENEGEQNEVSLYVDRKGKKVKEAHFVVKGEENIIVLSIFGDITVEDN